MNIKNPHISLQRKSWDGIRNQYLLTGKHLFVSSDREIETPVGPGLDDVQISNHQTVIRRRARSPRHTSLEIDYCPEQVDRSAQSNLAIVPSEVACPRTIDRAVETSVLFSAL